jgi:hypothetical protein
MAQKNRALIVFGSLVVIGSVGYYLWSKSKKSKGEGSSEPTPKDDSPQMGKADKSKDDSKPKADKPKADKPKADKPKDTYVPSVWIETPDRVKVFQKWLDDNYPKLVRWQKTWAR